MNCRISSYSFIAFESTYAYTRNRRIRVSPSAYIIQIHERISVNVISISEIIIINIKHNLSSWNWRHVWCWFWCRVWWWCWYPATDSLLWITQNKGRYITIVRVRCWACSWSSLFMPFKLNEDRPSSIILRWAGLRFVFVAGNLTTFVTL